MALVAQTIFATPYGEITLSGGSSAVKTLGGSIIVQGLVTIAASTEFAVGASNTLTLNAATSFSNSGTFTASASGATVVYNNSSNQDVTGAAYYNLTIANGGTKTVNSGASTLSIAAGGTLTNGTGIFNLGSYALSTTATSSINNSGTIQTAGSVTFGAAHSISGTFIYQNSTSSQTLSAANYTNLTLSSGSGATGQKNFPAVTISVSGTYAVSGADRSYGTGTFAYSGTAAQSVLGETYNNLTITTTGGNASASAAITLSGNLVVNNGSTLDMAGFSSSSFPGASNNNAGTIRWSASNVYVAGTGMTEFYGSSPGNIAVGTSYGSMLFSGTGAMTFTGSTTATGNVTINSGAPITVNNGVTVQIDGDLTAGNTFENNGTITAGN